MFKVFHRGQKVQFNSNEHNTSINKIQNDNLALSYDHIRRRSIRSTFADSDSASVKIGHKTNLTPKKYVSCDNFAQNNYEDEYQEVIDEEFEDENGIKDKIVKRYNSLTNLLMRSFRKAKIKKKKEAMLQENSIDEVEVPAAESQTNRQRQENSLSNKEIEICNRLQNIRKKSEIVSNYDDDTESVDDPSDGDDNKNQDNSVPIFKGAKLITNEFVEYNRENKSTLPTLSKIANSNNLTDLNSKSKKTNLNEIYSKTKSHDTKIKPVNQNQSSTNKETAKKSEIEIKPTAKPRNDHSNRIEKSCAVEVMQKFSSHTKPQAPKAPAAAKIETNNDNQHLTSEKTTQQETNQEKIPNKNTTTTKNPLIVKRSKTFTQQLQEILKDHKINKPEVASNQSIIIRRCEEKNEQNTSELNSYYQKQANKNDKYFDKSFATVLSDDKRSLSMRSNTTLSHMTNSLVIDSNKKHEITQDYLDMLDETTFAFNDQFKSINDFNKMQFETNSIEDNFVDNNDKEEFKDLIQVLSRQEPEFKKKFFDCLMTKLWDASLPTDEYFQLNKLMIALFGDNYHNFGNSQNIKNTQIDYLNLKSTKNSKVDAEYIVNLMKVYLDSKSNKRKNHSENNKSSNENLVEDLSISNLINSLRVRQKDECSHLSHITPRSSNFNLIGANVFDLEDKLKLYGNEFSFRNGFNGLSNQSTQSKAKSSLILKLDEREDDTYNKDNFINHSVIEEYSSKSAANQEREKSSFKSFTEDKLSQFSYDSKSHRTFLNYDRSLNNVVPNSTSCTTQNALNKNNQINVLNEELKYQRLNAENQIAKIIKKSRINMSSPLSYNNKIDKSTTSINNEISMSINKISLSNISVQPERENIIDSEHTQRASKQLNECQSKVVPKSNGVISSFQPNEISYNTNAKNNLAIQQQTNEHLRTKSEKIVTRPTYNVVRTVVQPPKPKIAMNYKSTNNTDQINDYLPKQKQFKVINIFKNVNENILNIKQGSPYLNNSSSMRKRDGHFVEPKFSYQKEVEPIYQVQKVSKKIESDSSNAVFNPTNSSISKGIRAAYAYLSEENNSRSLNHINEEYHRHYLKKKSIEYNYEPVKKIVSHQLKDLMTEKIYKFERKEMQQAFY